MIHEALDVRTVRVTGATGRFLLWADDATIAELERTTKEVQQKMAGKSNVDTKLLDAALQVDWHMHNLIVESMGNRILMTAHQQNFDKIKMIRLHGRSPRYLPLAMNEHLAVIQAIKRRDPEAAAWALEQHLKAAERRALGL